MKKEITPLYAVEYAGHEMHGRELTVYAAGRHIGGRGDCLNVGMLTVRLYSPVRNILHVTVSHFEGGNKKRICADTADLAPEITLQEDERQLIFRTGSLQAVISKEPDRWEIAYYDGDRFLTHTGYRNLAHMSNRDTGKTYMTEQLALTPGEYVYGLGERFTPFVKNGQSVEIWNEDGGTASEQTYKNIPFYLTNRGYGVLVDSMGDVEFEIASEKVEQVQFSVQGERIGYYLIAGGSPKGTIERYTELTGRPALPPAWSFGLWLTTSFTTDYDEATTGSFIQGMADREIPLHVFHFDCYWMQAYHWCDFLWDPQTFPDPQGMIRRYKDRGLKICVWINPYIAQRSYLFAEGKDAGYLVKKRDGSVWQTDLWQPGMALVDFTNPNAAQWYRQKLKKLLDIGVDCFKTDFGERIPVRDICWYDGSDAEDMHNYYTYLYNRTVFELLGQERGAGEAVVFARSAVAGGQRFPVHWGGDCSATYSSMAETMRGGLSLACCGFAFWSHDISGFEQTASADIYKRWCQFGLLSSHSRLHGSSSYRVPWLFDEEACVVLKEMVELKCRLMPYLYRLAVEAHENGLPMMRPMFVEFPQDRSCLPLDMQYMLGDSLLVAPVFEESGEVEYYLPEGSWYNLLTRETLTGPGWKKGRFDYHGMPLLAAPGRILPIGSCASQPEYDYTRDVTLLITELKDKEQIQTFIPDPKGQKKMSVRAVRDGRRITVTVTGGGSWSCRAAGHGRAEIEQKEDQAVILLKEGCL